MVFVFPNELRANYYFMELNAFFEFQIFYSYTAQGISFRVSTPDFHQCYFIKTPIIPTSYPCISVNFIGYYEDGIQLEDDG